jgi:hypothetical protein
MKTAKTKKKQTEMYAIYKIRENLSLNKSQKKLKEIENYDSDEERYSIENRDKNGSNNENGEEIVEIQDKNNSESDIYHTNNAFRFSIRSKSISVIITSIERSRSSSSIPTKHKKQSQNLPRTEIGKKARKSRVEEVR